jgi:hypothetical protein
LLTAQTTQLAPVNERPARFGRKNAMADGSDHEERPARASANPYSGSSLVLMLVAGLVLTVFGMIVAAALS